MDHEKKDLYIAKRASGVEIHEDVLNAWDTVRNDEDPTSWILCKVESGQTVVTLHGSGSGGVEELISYLHEDEVFFGGIRVQAGGDRIKFLHFYFVGQNVGGMKKGKSSLYKNGVFQSFEGAIGEITCSSGFESATLEAITSQINALLRAAEGR